MKAIVMDQTNKDYSIVSQALACGAIEPEASEQIGFALNELKKAIELNGFAHVREAFLVHGFGIFQVQRIKTTMDWREAQETYGHDE